MASSGPNHILRKARTASGLPGRVVAVEDRMGALEEHVAARLDEVRHELAEIRALLTTSLEADGDATELVGRLLQASSARIEALEALVGATPKPEVTEAVTRSS